VFGFPVEHSLSPAMHNAAIAALRIHYLYIPYSVQPDNLGPAIHSLIALGITGVNLTIPHKEDVLPFLHEISPAAQAVGAVNTVHNENGRLIGYNTDGEGFLAPLKEQGFSAKGKKAVVLGAGGSARSVVFALVQSGAEVILVNRTTERAAGLAGEANRMFAGEAVRWIDFGDTAGLVETLAGAELLVNTTSVGMHPKTDEMPPVPPESLHSDLLVYDLIYNPLETRLLTAARKAGAQTLNGVKMLVNQGAAAFRIWTGIEPPLDVMESAVLEGLKPTA
jgi:shikimate dehydrogenase